MGLKREIVGVGALDNPYEMNDNGFEADSVVRGSHELLGRLSLQVTLNETNKMEIFPINQTL